MIYEYKKYADIFDFVNNSPKTKTVQKYTILHKCKGITINDTITEYNANCFGCLFCAVNDRQQKDQFLNYYGKERVFQAAENAFSGHPIAGPKTLSGFKHPYTSFEKFTGVDETTNIQPWAAGVLSKMSTSESRVGMEIPVFNNEYDRNGRLDIGIISNGNLLAIESKISLDDALKDERFIEQHIKYTAEIEKATKHYTYLTLFGGSETELFPPDSIYCTGKIGDKSLRFYNMITENKIQFITANALWCLCCKYLIEGPQYNWNQWLIDIFSNPKCVGLCSGGAIIAEGNRYIVISLN